eukprot:CAMPEP_0185797922 /NCGR_PEP_ID=MMETSP1174-20130828/161877_1 /TAXON_ID=35687 /ORGANISM="Dictyocha speculum, Strain CCMP1381" /LENGTH=86 /DNA_ID=CAMNT_0028493387 /DNA_START=727 /DNA_END=983 /DNA_ORIENTATION=+
MRFMMALGLYLFLYVAELVQFIWGNAEPSSRRYQEGLHPESQMTMPVTLEKQKQIFQEAVSDAPAALRRKISHFSRDIQRLGSNFA